MVKAKGTMWALVGRELLFAIGLVFSTVYLIKFIVSRNSFIS